MSAALSVPGYGKAASPAERFCAARLGLYPSRTESRPARPCLTSLSSKEQDWGLLDGSFFD